MYRTKWRMPCYHTVFYYFILGHSTLDPCLQSTVHTLRQSRTYTSAQAGHNAKSRPPCSASQQKETISYTSRRTIYIGSCQVPDYSFLSLQATQCCGIFASLDSRKVPDALVRLKRVGSSIVNA